ncbi:MAG TPA: FHA domain-containing protein [Anaerolineaceae bacterium]|jgi:pSer/pThr/pTyr-binding forkhead associated (FHA) protein|nr:FHA domain-containing protein [Anaerolineaceae bacterium]
MIICPNCHHHELPGAMFCSECGTPINLADTLTTQSIHPSTADLPAPPVEAAAMPVVAGVGDAIVSLHILEAGKVVPLEGRTEFTLGRAAEGQPILPDIDLSSYDAYTLGVSRLHAAIKIIGQRVVIVDLGSSNGTRVNGQKIIPNADFPLSHGDMLSLGKLKIQVLIHY